MEKVQNIQTRKKQHTYFLFLCKVDNFFFLNTCNVSVPQTCYHSKAIVQEVKVPFSVLISAFYRNPFCITSSIYDGLKSDFNHLSNDLVLNSA